MTDPISDMIIRIRNAAAIKLPGVVFPLSKKTLAIAQTLEKEGYIEILSKKGKKTHKQIEANLVFVAGNPKFKGARKISNVSKRVYRKIKDVSPVKSGYGSLIMSTPKGIMTDKEARKENVGGEALFQIW